jgi:TetR/AcrR family transcriptional regulator
MTEQDRSTRERILAAATAEFVEKGLAGARMQEIADRAGANKAMLHYYFGDKERLYETVIGSMIRELFGGVSAALIAEGVSPEERIPRVVGTYFDFIAEHPYLPRLFVQDILAGGSKLAEALRNAQRDLDIAILSAVERFAQSVGVDKLRPIDPRQLIVSLISLVVFYFVAHPVLDSVLEISDPARFLEERRRHITDLFLHGVLPCAGEAPDASHRGSADESSARRDS